MGTTTHEGVRAGVALAVVALASLQVFSGCALGALESAEDLGEEESVGTTGQALACFDGPPPFSATASPNAIQPANNAIDGSPGTRWESAWQNNQFLTIDLNTTINMGAVTLNWEAACGRDYDIDVATSAAPTTWTRFATVRGNTQSGVVTHEGFGHKARYVRMTGLTRCTQYGFSLWEISVSKVATQCFTDSDGDGQGVSPFIERCGECPTGTVSNSVDCYDSNANAKRGQATYFSTHRGDTSFDYDCNGVEEKESFLAASGCTAGSAYPNCVSQMAVQPPGVCGKVVPVSVCVAKPPIGKIPGRCVPTASNGPRQPCR